VKVPGPWKCFHPSRPGDSKGRIKIAIRFIYAVLSGRGKALVSGLWKQGLFVEVTIYRRAGLGRRNLRLRRPPPGRPHRPPLWRQIRTVSLRSGML